MGARSADALPATMAGRLAAILHRGGVYGALPLLIGVVFADVVLRFVFSTPLMWGNEVSLHIGRSRVPFPQTLAGRGIDPTHVRLCRDGLPARGRRNPPTRPTAVIWR